MASAAPARKPIREDLLTGPLDDLGQVRLCGGRCKDCGEATLGLSELCPNCGGADVAPITFSGRGSVWTYTVVRYRPPGDYKGPEPFVPFALGLIELPEGLRVLAPIGGDPEAVKIGMPVQFHPYAREDGVVEFNYSPVDVR